MRPTHPLASAVVLVSLPGCLALMPDLARPPAGGYVTGQVLTEFSPGTPVAQMKQLQRQAGATQEVALTDQIWQATVPPGTEAQVIGQLMRQRQVAHAEYALKVHDDMVGGFTLVKSPPPRSGAFRVQQTPSNPLFNPADGLPGQWGLGRILATQAWDSGAEGQGVEVAVVDTGVDLSHPDLVNNLDLANGANTFDAPKPPDDDFGHGTHVAGIIAAQLGPIGTVGVAPRARIIPVRVMGVDGGTTDQLVAGLDHVLATPARIVNLSLGSNQASAIEQDEIEKLLQKGIVVVAAAGNEALDGNPIEYPASIPGVLSVAATREPTSGSTDPQDEHAVFSNFNPFLALAAPGVDILSTVPGQVGQGATAAGAYAYASGTSMAAPMVSGVAALIWSAHPGWSGAQVEAQLLKTAAEPPAAPAGFSDLFGHGVVDAQAAVGS